MTNQLDYLLKNNTLSLLYESDKADQLLN